ncbi:MAG: hypothetical protein QY321_02955 [Patescibacteria group bacterium]|nr:MAG: hypothetical protein QY321_02955 [Patescibacteria group bacterium]
MYTEPGLNFENSHDDNNENTLEDTFEYNEDVVVTPQEGDLVLSDFLNEDDSEWAFFPMKNQFKKEHKTVLLFNNNEDEKFIKNFVGAFSRNYPNLKPGIFKINMQSYDYWKEEPDFDDVVFIKVTPELVCEKWKMTNFGPLNFGKEDI